MATKFTRVNSDYDKKVKESDSEYPQDKKKFGNYMGEKSVKPYSGVENTKQKLSQKINEPMDSGEGQGAQKNEGGSKTRNDSKGKY